jgi:diguanylate cyclase (GGDEF)-like protein
MDNKPFVEAFRDLNASYLKLVDSLSALRALSSLSVGGNSDALLLENALGVLVDNQDLERCSIYLLQGEELINVAGLAWDDLICLDKDAGSEREGCKPTFQLGEGLVGLAAQSGQLQHCRDCSADSRLLPHCKACEVTLAGHEEPGKGIVGSVISAPISIGDEVLGVLNVTHPHRNFFDEGHVRTLRIFCNVLGQLLKNNRLFHEMDEQVRQRTLQLQKALDDAEELKQRYERLSVIDDLTQLHNRRFFFPECRAALARNIREAVPFSILLLDVDHFKQINDNFGHASGDTVLFEVAAAINNQIREGDILARFGGEEFILALPNTDKSGAMMLAERIREVINAMSLAINGSEISVSLSIGISGASEYSDKDSQKLLDRFIMEADQALYFGKQHGRDQSRAYADIACEI